MNQQWRYIPGFIRYQASDAGNIRRAFTIGNFLPGPVKSHKNPNGYEMVSLSADDGRRRKIGVHQLVMLAFAGPVPAGMCVCHNNGDPADNSLSNLRYGTQLSNNHDRIKHGTLPFGEKCVVSVITEAAAIDIYNRCLTGERQADIAADHGITQGCVSDVFRRKTWKHLNLPRIRHVRRFNLADVAEMTRLFSAGVSKSEIARKFQTSPQAVFYHIKKQELAA